MARVYCGRAGGAVEFGPSAPCPECDGAYEEHYPLPNGICGVYVRCDDATCEHVGPRSHGHWCRGVPGHVGPHSSGRAVEVRP